MIPFNKAPFFEAEAEYMRKAAESGSTGGDGEFTDKCSRFLEKRSGSARVLLTNSGTAALEMAALLCDLSPGDEVILPSFTFSSTANAFVRVGARLVFVDVRADTMNIDEDKIEAAITERTRVICVVHYGGMACNMERIMKLARENGLLVVEDAAQAVMSGYKGAALGAIGNFGCYSFHATKNFSMGEGGALLINRPEDIERAELIWENGTNRAQFFRGEAESYRWLSCGGNYLPSELNAACLWAQLERAEEITADRLRSFELYGEELKELEGIGVSRSAVPKDCVPNGHIFFLMCRSEEERARFISFMNGQGISCRSHYIPLHSSPAGQRFGRFAGLDEHTSDKSARLVRLPLYFGMGDDSIVKVIENTRLLYFGAKPG